MGKVFHSSVFSDCHYVENPLSCSSLKWLECVAIALLQPVCSGCDTCIESFASSCLIHSGRNGTRMTLRQTIFRPNLKCGFGCQNPFKQDGITKSNYSCMPQRLTCDIPEIKVSHEIHLYMALTWQFHCFLSSKPQLFLLEESAHNRLAFTIWCSSAESFAPFAKREFCTVNPLLSFISPWLPLLMMLYRSWKYSFEREASLYSMGKHKGGKKTTKLS